MAACSFLPQRLVVCLHEGPSFETWLGRAGQFVAALAESSLEIVATTGHDLDGRRRHAIERLLGRRPEVVHLVPRASDIERFAERRAGRSGLVLTDRRRAWWRSPGQSPVLTAAAGPSSGRTIIALADPSSGQATTACTAIDLADRLSASRVVVCHLFFDESVWSCDECEARILAREHERLQVYMARVPFSAATPVVSRLAHAPARERAIARLVREEDAALVVCHERLRVEVPVLTVPEASSLHSGPGWAIDAALKRLAAFPSGAT